MEGWDENLDKYRHPVHVVWVAEVALRLAAAGFTVRISRLSGSCSFTVDLSTFCLQRLVDTHFVHVQGHAQAC
jgi:hypothetical protein